MAMLKVGLEDPLSLNVNLKFLLPSKNVQPLTQNQGCGHPDSLYLDNCSCSVIGAQRAGVHAFFEISRPLLSLWVLTQIDVYEKRGEEEERSCVSLEELKTFVHLLIISKASLTQILFWEDMEPSVKRLVPIHSENQRDVNVPNLKRRKVTDSEENYCNSKEDKNYENSK